MNRILFIATMAVVVSSCSRDGGSDDQPQKTNPISLGKKLKRESSDNFYSIYQWKDEKLIKTEFYKDGFLQDYTKISYENNLRKIDSVFNVGNKYLRRNIYSYNSDGLLVLEENHKVGYFYEKRMEALRRLNEGYINREEYLKEIENIKKNYTPHIKNLIAKIPYSIGSSMYNDAVYEIEKNNDAPYMEYRYAYDSRGYISKRTTLVEGKLNRILEYNYSNDRRNLTVKYITNPNTNSYYTAAFTFDGKKGAWSDITPNKKADYFYNTIEWKVINNNTSTSLKNYTSKYTYDQEGNPLTEERTYDDGSKLNRTFTWE